MVVSVIFNEGGKIYYYNTNKELIVGGIYDIVTSGDTGSRGYDSYVKVLDIDTDTSVPAITRSKFRTITHARLVRGASKPEKPYVNIYTNKEKRTTCVVWKDGTRTVMKAHPDDEWDVEKGVALCFMKKAFDNRGCYYDSFKDVIEQ